MIAVELKMVALASVILLVHLFAAALIRFGAFGVGWASGPRDNTPGEVPLTGQRCERAFRNMLETFPIFVALAIAVVVAGIDNGTTAFGSVLYVIARALYLPAYVVHIPLLRSSVWGVALLGIILTGAPLFAALVS